MRAEAEQVKQRWMCKLDEGKKKGERTTSVDCPNHDDAVGTVSPSTGGRLPSTQRGKAATKGHGKEQRRWRHQGRRHKPGFISFENKRQKSTTLFLSQCTAGHATPPPNKPSADTFTASPRGMPLQSRPAHPSRVLFAAAIYFFVGILTKRKNQP